MKNNVIKELNTFLEGNFMAIHAYEKYIQQIKDEHLKAVLQKIQQQHKEHAMLIAERIQNLGGIPADDAGMMGMVAKLINSIKGSTSGSAHILQDALVGEQRGIEKSKELLNGDLDPESRTLVKQILDTDQKHIDILNKLVH